MTAIKKAVKLVRSIQYDCVVVLLDTDIPWQKQDIELANSNKIELVGSRPCCEGLLLSILKRPIPKSSDDCKAEIERIIPSLKPLVKESYAPHFNKEVLEEARARIHELDKLLEYFEGG